MKRFGEINKEIVCVLRAGGVGVLPTDTLYGLVGSALNKKAVSRIYQLKKRAPEKPFIILISSPKDLELFNVKPDEKASGVLKNVWPGPVSVVLPCNAARLSYLRRKTKGLAFRLPKPAWLRKLLLQTGPLVAPSANWQGMPPAQDIKQAKQYFSNQVDFYCDAGKIRGQASALIAITRQGVKILRQGPLPKTLKL
jgi:L-threonylcarbamoyladenylate synthase